MDEIRFFLMIAGVICISYSLGFKKGRQIGFLDILAFMNISIIKFLPKLPKETKRKK